MAAAKQRRRCDLTNNASDDGDARNDNVISVRRSWLGILSLTINALFLSDVLTVTAAVAAAGNDAATATATGSGSRILRQDSSTRKRTVFGGDQEFASADGGLDVEYLDGATPTEDARDRRQHSEVGEERRRTSTSTSISHEQRHLQPQQYERQKPRSSYPEYCSKPAVMDERAIPPLNVTDLGLKGKTQILQSVVIIRHGARTPYKPLDSCWDGYDTMSDGTRWDCNLKSLMAPARHPTSPTDTGMFLFEKNYDALQPPQHNLLGSGNCLKGQLLDEGYDMELANGRHIREAYVNNTDARHMQLFDSPRYEDRPYEKSTYFRVDDEQRTLMSGQILISGVFDVDDEDETVMPLHTADYAVDVVAPNEYVCPSLPLLRYEAGNATEYKSHVGQPRVKQLDDFIRNTLRPPGGDVDRTWDQMVDCLMTTMCTDRQLPESIDDFKSDGDDSMFSRLYREAVYRDTVHYPYKNGMYSKMGMGPMWKELYEPLSSASEAKSLMDMESSQVPRLILVSGHDTTLLPVLVSLGEHVWDGQWPPYSSMIVLETHHIFGFHTDFPSAHGFRLIYNGEVITGRMKDCPDTAELCDMYVLLNHLQPLVKMEDVNAMCHANDTANAEASTSTAVPRNDGWSITSLVARAAASLEYTDDGAGGGQGGKGEGGLSLALTLIIATVGAVISSTGTFVLTTGRLPFSKRYLFPQRVYDNVDTTMGGGGGGRNVGMGGGSAIASSSGDDGRERSYAPRAMPEVATAASADDGVDDDELI